MADLDIDFRGKAVLCLAARLGTEVKSFLDLGSFAVGVDLNPGQNNRFVLYGDFHELQFPDQSIDLIFCNSLDHVFDISKLLKEIGRTLKPEGWFVVEALEWSRQGILPGHYESFWCSKVDDLAIRLAGSGLSIIKKSDFNVPWAGRHLCFQVKGDIETL